MQRIRCGGARSKGGRFHCVSRVWGRRRGSRGRTIHALYRWRRKVFLCDSDRKSRRRTHSKCHSRFLYTALMNTTSSDSRARSIVYITLLLLLSTCTVRAPEETAERVNSSSASEATTTNPMIVAENLRIPWDIAFLPSGELLVTERSGTLLRIGDDQKKYEIEGVHHRGEGGLLGIALHPDFERNKLLYLYLTTKDGGGVSNRIERYRYHDDELTERLEILSGIPGSLYHDGGPIAFGPEGFLYITTGDAGEAQNAQEKNSFAGKILRIEDDGTIPADNPFGNVVYSYGHRNPQGLTWDDQGRLWSTEHGRSGLQSGYDELNLIEKGKNYGWPVIEGPETREEMVAPE